MSTSKAGLKAGGKAVAPWDEKGFKLPGGPVYSKAGMQFFPAANAILRRETYDNYPAARAIMQCVYEGLQLPMDAALRVESRWFSKILRSKEAAAMIRSLFVSMGELNKGARRPENVPATKVKKLAVIGAGFMGASVGFVSAQAGIDVVLPLLAQNLLGHLAEGVGRVLARVFLRPSLCGRRRLGRRGTAGTLLGLDGGARDES